MREAPALPLLVALAPQIAPHPIAVTFTDPVAPLVHSAPDQPGPIPLAPTAPELVRPTIATPEPLLPIDTRRHEWIAALADRIDRAREAVGPRETSIRLSPDALGTVDIAVSQDGDQVNVRITAETPAARALLAEAQPRLAELAEARGLRLGQTSFEAGVAGQGQGQGQRQDSASGRPRPSAPPPARADADTDTEERIA